MPTSIMSPPPPLPRTPLASGAQIPTPLPSPHGHSPGSRLLHGKSTHRNSTDENSIHGSSTHAHSPRDRLPQEYSTQELSPQGPLAQGPYLHPRRQYTSQVPSFPGPLNVCPFCFANFGSEWQRDIHYLEFHLLGIKLSASYQAYEDGEVGNWGNYDGDMGRGKHVVEPWRFCAEPDVYADEDGDLIPGKQYNPPSDTFFFRNGVRYCNANILPPRAKARYAQMLQRVEAAKLDAARREQQDRERVARESKEMREMRDMRDMGEMGEASEAKGVKRKWVEGEGEQRVRVRGRRRSVL